MNADIFRCNNRGLLRMRNFLLVVVLAVCGYAYAESQTIQKNIPPVAKQTKAGNDGKNKQVNKEQTASINFPACISVTLTFPNGEIRQNQKYCAYDEPSKWLDPMTWFTLILVIANILLWLTTRVAAHASRLAAHSAMESTKLANKEFLSTHRPKIRVKHLWLQNDIWNGEQIVLRLVVVNHGDSDATIAEINTATLIVNDEHGLPAVPPFKDHAIFGQMYPKLASGMTNEYTGVTDGRVLTDAEIDAIENGRSRLFCFGYVDYRDMEGRVRKTAFCKVLTFPHPRTFKTDARFVDHHDPDYAYED